jgi:hypothetical protein
MTEADSFFNRWSRRKADVRDGKSVQAEAPAVALPAATAVAPQEPLPAPAAEPPPPTLDDAQALTPQSDFKPFVAQNVSPEVKNTALKKLFADPHFNVMDGMDTYIDDYSKGEPIPEAMLRSMVGSQLLGLFDTPAGEEAKPNPASGPKQSANTPLTADVAQSPATTTDMAAETQPKAHEHDLPDLQLQPNHAAGGSGAATSPA